MLTTAITQTKAPMLLVSGATTTMRGLAGEPALGHLLTPATGNRSDLVFASGMPVAADNACFGGLDEPRFVAMLVKLAAVDRWRRTLWVTVPDKVGDAGETFALWRYYHHFVRGSLLRMAFVAQDDAASHPIPWYKLDCLFLGGSTAYKLGPEAASLAREAKRRGKWVHVGRLNTAPRLRYFESLAIDSFDGTQFSRYPQTYIPAWLDRLTYRQQDMGIF